mmetsp:Transcript_91601/g.126302  ORF Transcript_91601/g.126302 Transcript_91601/m.126302 type:complete len:360 (+) Transcript_91601:4920-5999(+)
MSNFEQFLELNNLKDEVLIGMEFLILDNGSDDVFKSFIDLSLNINIREEIVKKTKENVKIFSDNLGSVEISQGSHEKSLFKKVRFSTLETSGHNEHGFDSSKTPIVVILFGEKIFTESVKSGKLLGENFGLDETFSHEHVFANKLKIRNDDSNRSEKSLKTFWQLRSTKITRVHSNESTTSWIKSNFIFLEEETRSLVLNSISNSLELNRTHRKHFRYESVKLIEATPRTRGSKTLENTSHTLVIHLIGTIKHIDSLSKSRGQIFSSFCFTCTGRTSGSTSHFQVKSLSGSHINSIGKRCNDKTWSITKVLITVPETSISNLEYEILFGMIPVGLKLRLPLELFRILNTSLNKLVNNIS